MALALPVVAASADEAPVAPPAPTHAAPVEVARPRLVGVILSSAQALLWDEERGEYVLHKVGDDLPGGRIVELDADHVVLERAEVRDVIEISAPPQMKVVARKARRMPAMIISAVPAASAGAPVAAATSDAAAAPVANAAPAAAPAPTMISANVVANVASPNVTPEGALAPATSTPALAATASSAPASSATPSPAPAPPTAASPTAASPAPVAAAPTALPAASASPAVTAPTVATLPSVASPTVAAAPAVATPAAQPVAAQPVVVPLVAAQPAAAPLPPPAAAPTAAPTTAVPTSAPTATPTATSAVVPAVQAPAAVAPAAAPAVQAPTAVAPAAAPVALPAPPATPAVAPSPAPVAAPISAIQIPRADLDRALGDFSALSQQLQVTSQPQGGFRLSQLQPGSFFARVGLRNDDVVLRVDGRPINGVDDAAAAYAWLRVTNRFAVEIRRGGRPMTLHYVITPQQSLTADAQ